MYIGPYLQIALTVPKRYSSQYVINFVIIRVVVASLNVTKLELYSIATPIVTIVAIRIFVTTRVSATRVYLEKFRKIDFPRYTKRTIR